MLDAKLGDTEVEQLDPLAIRTRHVGYEHDVPRLDVAMNNRLGMCGG
jgi:hypothetical protein